MTENTEVKISISNTLQLMDVEDDTESGVFKTHFMNSKNDNETRNMRSIEWPGSAQSSV